MSERDECKCRVRTRGCPIHGGMFRDYEELGAECQCKLDTSDCPRHARVEKTYGSTGHTPMEEQ